MNSKPTPKTKSKTPPPPSKRFRLPVVRLDSPLFGRLYVWFALVVLGATTIFWAYKSAAIQLNNADQLVDPYLFTSHSVFRVAQFPGAHSFLIKWPLFYLVRLLDFHAAAYNWLTVGLVVLTVGGFVWLLYKIERRPLYFGSLVLALASVLLLVPAEPYAGALLPANFAMLATRNIEYVVYIISLILIIRAKRLRDLRVGLALVLQLLLFASDRYFLVVSLGAAFIGLLVFALDRSWKLTQLNARWLLINLLSAVGGLLALAAINVSKLTAIVGGSESGPYGLVNSSHDLALGLVYGFSGLLTNFGANPAYDVGLIRQVPSQFVHRLFSPSGFGFLVNLGLFAVVIWACVAVIGLRFRHHHHQDSSSQAEKLVYMLLASGLSAFIFFVATKHYYFVDSRYLTIILFALLATTAVWLRTKQFATKTLVAVGALVCLGIVCGLFAAQHQYTQDNKALADINQRNSLAAQALKSRPEQVLVGDYWRVLPIRFMASGRAVNVLPMENCAQPRTSLTSTAWGLNLSTHSFAYLLPLDKGPAGFPECSLSAVVSRYGRPDASTIIAGTFNKPRGLLLFYDHGIHKSKAPALKAPATVVPINLSDLPQTNCRNNQMNIVAHQDDDLLFMNPDLITSIQAGDCQRTVYLTAGDAGNSKFYWLSRERGSQAAYDEMAGLGSSLWIERIVKLATNEYVTVDSPRNDQRVSLIFMHLPDGNLTGKGFKDTNYESLAKLDAGKISPIHSEDGQSSYTKAQLVDALNGLMQFYQPDLIRTQANYISKTYPDHSDHMAVGRLAKSALSLYNPSGSASVKYYIGYPIHGFPSNISTAETQQKLIVFLTYAAYDKSVCQSAVQCGKTPTYGSYLSRQYINSY